MLLNSATVDNSACLCLTRSGLSIIKSGKEPESVPLDSCYSERFIDLLNDNEFVGQSDYSNEIFLYYYIKFTEFCVLLRDYSRSRCGIFPGFVDRFLFLKASESAGHKRTFAGEVLGFVVVSIGFVFSVISILLLSAIIPLYLFRKKGNCGSISDCCPKKSIFIIRSESSYQKCKVKIEKSDSSLTFYDNYGSLNVPGFSIYSVICWSNIFRLSSKSVLCALNDIKNFFYDSRQMLGVNCALALFPGYVSRISHKVVYECCLSELVRLFPEADFFTGDKDDRFALLQTRICKRNKNRLFCLPHGLEYGFRFPGGLSGTTFYCFTPEAANVLNNLYNESKFLYSQSIVDDMYGVDAEPQESEKVKRVCFFTEPRDPEVNYKIIKRLKKDGLEFSVKLHPLENPDGYKKKFPEINQIQDFNDAINSTVCLARKSTVLLDATQRGAKAIAILINEKDSVYVMKIFPSLCSKRIIRVSSFDELHKILLQ